MLDCQDVVGCQVLWKRWKRPQLRLEVHCIFVAWFLSYAGERNGSNMVIVDVKMLSGFIPVKSSVRKVGCCVKHFFEYICP